MVTTRCCSLGGCPQVNKFEQVSSVEHQTSVGPRSDVWEAGGVGALPCDLSHDAFNAPPPCEQTKNLLPSRNFVRLRAVISWPSCILKLTGSAHSTKRKLGFVPWRQCSLYVRTSEGVFTS